MNGRARLPIVLALFGLLIGAEARAQGDTADPAQLTLEQLLDAEVPIVTGASRYAQHLTDAPASITIVTREEIEQFGYRTLAEVLRSARGFYVTYDRNYTYLGTRGLARPGDYNTRVLLLVDGHRLNENIYDSALIGTEFPLDIELIDRVEIVRGPSSSLYGSNALFAVVNVITRRGADQPGVRASTTLGSLGTTRVQGSFARLFSGGSHLLVAASRYHSDGQADLAFPEVGAVARGMDHDAATRVFAVATRSGWTGQVLAATRDKQIPTGAYGIAFDDPRSQTTDARGFAALKYDGPVAGVSLQAKAVYDWYRYDGAYAYGGGSPLFRDYGRGGWWTFEAVGSRRYAAHTLTGGVELRDHRRQDQGQYDDAEPRVWYMDDRRSSRVWSLFAQDEVTIGRQLILNAGVRHDHDTQWGGETNPRVAVIYKPVHSASLKLLHGRSFRSPNLYERYYYGENAALLPEHIHTTELVAERYGASGLRVGASAFVYRVERLITPQATGDDLSVLAFYNADTIEVAGVEFEAERAWVGGWQTAAALTVQEATGRGASGLSNSPKYLGRLRFAGPLWPALVHFGVEALYTGTRDTLAGDEAGGFALGFLTVRTTRPLAGFTLALDIDNLLNRTYGDPGSEEHSMALIPQDGRTLALTATWRF